MCNIPPRLAGPPPPWTPPYLMAVFTQVDLSSSEWFVEAAGQRRPAWEVVAPAATRVALPVSATLRNNADIPTALSCLPRLLQRSPRVEVLNLLDLDLHAGITDDGLLPFL
jgi:hypothetical protein